MLDEKLKSEQKERRVKLTRSNSATYRNDLNYGVRLYQRGMKQIENLKKSAELQKVKEISQLEESCTYHPQINEISSLIAVKNNPLSVRASLTQFYPFFFDR